MWLPLFIREISVILCKQSVALRACSEIWLERQLWHYFSVVLFIARSFTLSSAMLTAKSR